MLYSDFLRFCSMPGVPRPHLRSRLTLSHPVSLGPPHDCCILSLFLVTFTVLKRSPCSLLLSSCPCRPVDLNCLLPIFLGKSFFFKDQSRMFQWLVFRISSWTFLFPLCSEVFETKSKCRLFLSHDHGQSLDIST